MTGCHMVALTLHCANLQENLIIKFSFFIMENCYPSGRDQIKSKDDIKLDVKGVGLARH